MAGDAVLCGAGRGREVRTIAELQGGNRQRRDRTRRTDSRCPTGQGVGQGIGQSGHDLEHNAGQVSDSQVHRPRVIVNFQLSQLISELTDRILMLIAEVIDLIELT